jgi:ubiquitin carboxyl-terminal hydrolase 47
LFANLQFGERNFYETKELTNSFGWSSRDSFIQQDVQELCRVLFDALDKTLSEGKGSPISDLYRGNYIDYIKTAPTHHGDFFERSHKADYLDLQLSISDVDSIEAALHKYQTPETMDGENQWRCEALGDIKVDAVKGFKFNQFPYILTLQLERFGYHPVQFYRIKYSHSVSFPFQLDMNQFMENSHEPLIYELFSVLIHRFNSYLLKRKWRC